MNYLKPISVYENYFSTSTGLTTPLNQFLRMVYDGEYQDDVERIRAEKDKKKRDQLKATLPAATISGIFSERKKSGLIQHSGFIALDVDANDNHEIKDWEKVRDELSNIKNVFFVALSVSGKGVFLVIPISNPEKHEQHFDALKMDFQDLGYVIDKSCRDVSRLRGMSYDPDAHINRGAISYERVYKRPRVVARTDSYKGHSESLTFLIEKIIASGIDITEGYEHWVQIGRALVNEYGEEGREYFHRLSQYYHGYDYDECDQQYNACIRSPGKASGGTIFHIAKEHGIMLKTSIE